MIRIISVPVFAFAILLTGCGETDYGSSKAPERAETADSVTITEEKADAMEDIDLRDSQWRLVALAGKAVEPPGGGGRAPRIQLLPDGTASGFGGCNRFQGNYELNGDKLSLGPIASTKMGCPEIGDMERRFFAVLSETAGYRIEEGELLLRDAEGNDLARLALLSGAGQ